MDAATEQSVERERRITSVLKATVTGRRHVNRSVLWEAKMKSLYALALAASTLMLAVTLVLWFVAFRIDHRKTFVRLGPATYVTLLARGLDCRIAVFNDPTAGLYQGSIISFVDGEEPKTTAFGDTGGIYYRNFQWPDREMSTLTVSLLYGLIVFGILPASYLLFGSIVKTKKRPQNKPLDAKPSISRFDLR